MTDGRNTVKMVPVTLAVVVLASMFLGVILAYLARAQGQGMVLQGVASVIDGDTLEIRGTRIRLHGIDATESGQTCEDESGTSYRCGQLAALALSDRIGRRLVTCDHRDTDRYGRMVAVCHQGAINLNAWMVREGHALAYRKYSTDYTGEEALAQLDRKGLWVGSFIPPWDWRNTPSRLTPQSQKPATPEKKSAARKCNIKGNVSRRSGERIYHVPGQKYYRATRISPDKGERWFCSEAEARAAGWRRARR